MLRQLSLCRYGIRQDAHRTHESAPCGDIQWPNRDSVPTTTPAATAKISKRCGVSRGRVATWPTLSAIWPRGHPPSALLPTCPHTTHPSVDVGLGAVSPPSAAIHPTTLAHRANRPKPTSPPPATR